MKRNIFLIAIASLLAAWVFNACQPEQFELGSSITKDALQYSISQNVDDPNMVILQGLNDGLTPYWETPTGRSTRVQDTVKIAFPGTYHFRYGVLSAAGVVQADTFTLEITTTNLSYVSDKLWENLTGGPGNEKVWLLDIDPDGNIKSDVGPMAFTGLKEDWNTYKWRAGGASDDDIKAQAGYDDPDGRQVWIWNPGYPEPTWMMADGTSDPAPAGDYGTMTFSLKGSPTVTIEHKMIDGRTSELSAFNFDKDAKTLTFANGDAAMLHTAYGASVVEDWSNMRIARLTEDLLTIGVYRPTDACYLYFNFISKDFNDNWTPGEEVVEEVNPPYDGTANEDLTTFSMAITWLVDRNVPYNWQDLAGNDINTVATTGTSEEGFAFSDWTPPYDSVVFDATSFTFEAISDNEGTYKIVTSEQTYEGTYTIDEKNNIDFGQPISIFKGMDGWFNLATTEENSLRIIKTEKNIYDDLDGIWLGQKVPGEDQYLSVHLKIKDAPVITLSPEQLLCGQTWKIDANRSFDDASSYAFGAVQGPVVYSDYASWSWNPKPGEQYAAGEAGMDYGTMKFNIDGTVTVTQRKLVYSFADDTAATGFSVRQGLPEDTDVLDIDETLTLDGTWTYDKKTGALTMSVGMLHPWTGDYAVADWGAVTMFDIKPNAALLQVQRDAEMSGEAAMPIMFIFVPAE